MKNITEGRRPSRPPGGKKLGLSDELWEIIRSSLAQEAKERPPISTFVNFLEKANPSVALFEALAQFNAYSERDIQRLRRIFEYGNNTLLGMREDETLAVIDVFDQVSLVDRFSYCSAKSLTSSVLRFSIPRWMTVHSATSVRTGFRKSSPGVAFCRRVTGSPMLASLNIIVLPPPQQGCPALAGG